MIREIQIRLRPKEASAESYYLPIAAEKIGVSPKTIKAIHVLKRSIDARKKQVWMNMSLRIFIDEIPKDEPEFNFKYSDVSDGQQIIIVGAGPAGLFAGLRCIELGLRPVILERGKKIAERKKDIANINKNQIIDEDSNYGFGEGGAGTFSDGKLYTRSLKRGNVKKILQVLCQHGASENILIDAHPHIGTDKLTGVITNIRKTIETCGGEVHFNTKVSGLLLDNNSILGVSTQNGKDFQGPVILATGHSARDVYHFLNNAGITLEQKTFAMGVRVEHPQTLIDQIQYHNPKGRGEFLPAASYSLVTQVEGRGVYSFCMCPGGFIVPAATSNEEIVVNGMSPSRRNSPWANSGIVVEIQPGDIPKEFNKDVLSGMRWQQWLEKECKKHGSDQVAPAQRLDDFVNSRDSKTLPLTSYIPGVQSSALQSWLPAHIGSRLQEGFKFFGKKVPGFLTNQAIILATESRTSSPVRIPRDRNTLQHISVAGLFPCGEGAGYAGGIASSAMDGEKCAEGVARYLSDDPINL